MLAAFLAGCATGDSIDESGETFDAISENATITLVGNEPFWAIEIAQDVDAGYLANYTTPENMDGSAFALVRFAGNNGLGFSGEIEGLPVQIAITPGECNDTMSDRTYPYTATVALDDRTLYGCGYTSDQMYDGEESQ